MDTTQYQTVPAQPAGTPPVESSESLAEQQAKLQIFALDDEKVPYYKNPLPNFNLEGTHTYDEWLPHIDYFYYSDVGDNKRGGKTIYVNPYKSMGRGARVQLCKPDEKIRCPFGWSVGKDINGNEVGDPNRPNLDMSLDNASLLKFCKALDDKTLAIANSRLKTWFKNKKITDAGSLYMSLVKEYVQPADKPKKDYSPILRTKLVAEGKGATQVLRKVGESPTGKWQLERASYRDLVKGVNVVPIVDLLGIWFMGQQFGMSLQCVCIIIIPKVESSDTGFVGMDIEIVSPTDQQTTGPATGSQIKQEHIPMGEMVNPDDYIGQENNQPI